MVITTEQARHFDADGVHVVGLAAPSRGSRELAAWRLHLEPGAASPPHALDREEVFVVLDGALVATYADRTETAGAGEALVLAPGEEVTLSAPADTALHAVAMVPAGAQATVAGATHAPPWAV
jgi:quercetin dioxygenase-like cupin family protein